MKNNYKLRVIKKNELNQAIKLLNKNLYRRNRAFLRKKFKANSKLFIGLFINDKIEGFICGFPRAGYLLLSQLALNKKFRKKGFGKKLVRFFEKNAGKKYKTIKVGAEDNALGFYYSLGYKPFLLIQYKKPYSVNDFRDMKIIFKGIWCKYSTLHVKTERKNVKRRTLKKLRKKYPNVYFQYIFEKKK